MTVYDQNFYEILGDSALRSASVIIPKILQEFKIKSVFDVGCGEGGWLQVWQKAGIEDFHGVDGSYITPEALRIPKKHFSPTDLNESFDLNRQFDLVQSLEVAEHLETSQSERFIESLIRHGKFILFSAAIPGQGGYQHINEQPFEFWRDIFQKRGYRQFDWIRPQLLGQKAVEPWYRYNVFLFAHESIVDGLSPQVKATEVPASEPVASYSPLLYRLRCRVISILPPAYSTKLSAVSVKVRLIKKQIFGGHLQA